MFDSDTAEDEGTYDYDYPEEFGQLAIGVPINADKLTVMLSSRAFEEKALNDSGLLTDMESSGKAELHVWAGASDNKTQDTSGWNASASADLNFGIADFSAKFYVKETKNACKELTYAALAGMSLKENMLLVLIKKGTPKQFYSCTTEDFRIWFTALSDAAIKADKAEKAVKAARAVTGADDAGDAENLKLELDRAQASLNIALQNFYDRYGTGFVSGLKLRAYGIVEASWRRETGSNARDFVIGGGIGGSLLFVGFNAAGQYVETHLDKNITTELAVNVFGRPPQSPQYAWAENKANGINTPKDLEDFLKGDAWSPDAATKVGEPDNPTIDHHAKAPDQVDVPELPGVIGVLGNAIKRLQSKLLKNVKSREPAGQPAGGSGDPAAIISGKQATLKAVARGEITINDASAGQASGGDASGEDASGGDPSGGDGSGGNASGGKDGDGGIPDKTALKLGGYVPFGYYYTPWEEIFPQLKLALQCTPAQLLFGQSLVWYSIRDMFAQYLEFCGNFHGVTRNKHGDILDVSVDASAFRAALDEVSNDLTRDLENAEGKTDFSFIDELEKKLRHRLDDDANFTLHDHYKFWLDNYHWLKQAPFGVVAVIQRGVDEDNQPQYYYQENPYPNNPMRDSTQPDGCALAINLSPAKLIRFSKAYRLYPIISTDVDGDPHFAWVGAPSPLKSLPNGDFDDNIFRYSGLMSFTPDSRQHLSFRPGPGNWGPDNAGRFRQPVAGDEVFSEVAVPMLIHQRPDAAEEMKRAEEILGDGLTERWNHRKRVFGMHLNPGVGDEEDPFGHEFRVEWIKPPWPQPERREIHDIRDGATERLLDRAGRLAHDATEYATVMPQVPKQDDQPEGDEQPTTDEPSKQHTHLWGLQEPEGVFGAYYEKQQAMFFWGPQGGGPGWNIPDLFTECHVKFVPIDYPDVDVALHAHGGSGPAREQPWAQAGGGAMWRQPRTDELTQRVKRLAETTKEEHDERLNEELKRHK